MALLQIREGYKVDGEQSGDLRELSEASTSVLMGQQQVAESVRKKGYIKNWLEKESGV